MGEIQHRKLADVADIVMGQSPTGDTCNKDGVGFPLLNGPTEFGSNHPTATQFTTDAKRLSQTGDLLFCVRGSTTGRMNWSDQTYAIGRGIAAIRHKTNPNLQPLIRAAIEYDLPRLLQSATGSTFPNVSASQLASVQFPDLIPSEEIAIASVLSALDDKIELNRRMNATLEGLARALFADWFVHFGPTRAKMAGDAPYLAPEIWSLFPDRLDESGVPEGWEMGTLADIAQSPRRGVKPADVGEDTPYIGLEHMPRRSIALTDWDGAAKVSSNKSRFRKGEFLFGKLRPYFHKVGVAAVDGICSTDIVVVTPKAEEWAALTLACISSDDFVEYTNAGSTGTKMPRTSWKIMAAYELCIPPREVAQAYQEIVWPMIEKIIDNIHQSRTLAQTRDLLLPRLMSGELRVCEAEKIVEGGG